MKTKTNLMRRIYLNGDPKMLPKENGNYITGWTGINDFIDELEYNPESVFESFKSEWWLENVKWYLQPIPQPKGLTDEMIKKQFPTDDKAIMEIEHIRESESDSAKQLISLYRRFNKLRQEGAKYARDQMQGNLREELIKFIKFSFEKQIGEQKAWDDSKMVDEYLKINK